MSSSIDDLLADLGPPDGLQRQGSGHTSTRRELRGTVQESTGILAAAYKAAASKFPSFITGSRAVTFNLPPPPNSYDTNSQVYKDTIKKPTNTLKLVVQHFPSVVASYEQELQTFDEQAGTVDRHIQICDDVMKRLGHAYSVVMAQKRTHEEHKKTIKKCAKTAEIRFNEKKRENMIADDVMKGKTQRFATAEPREVQRQIELETQEQWNRLYEKGMDNMTDKFIELDNDSWAKSEHCPETKITTHPKRTSTGTENKLMYYERLMWTVRYTPPAGAASPEEAGATAAAAIHQPAPVFQEGDKPTANAIDAGWTALMNDPDVANNPEVQAAQKVMLEAQKAMMAAMTRISNGKRKLSTAHEETVTEETGDDEHGDKQEAKRHRSQDA